MDGYLQETSHTGRTLFLYFSLGISLSWSVAIFRPKPFQHVQSLSFPALDYAPSLRSPSQLAPVKCILTWCFSDYEKCIEVCINEWIYHTVDSFLIPGVFTCIKWRARSCRSTTKKSMYLAWICHCHYLIWYLLYHLQKQKVWRHTNP